MNGGAGAGTGVDHPIGDLVIDAPRFSAVAGSIYGARPVFVTGMRRAGSTVTTIGAGRSRGP
jgi:hypothetical protein